MKRNVIIAIASLLVSLSCHAQKWRVGVTVGGDVNTYCIDKQYQYDWRYKKGSGISMGVMGQYQISDWFALRADLNYTQKNYRQYRTGNTYAEDYTHHNSYVQLPVMGSFSFGGERLRGFLNLGVYGAYWAGSSICGTTSEAVYLDGLNAPEFERPAPVDQSYVFNSVRDNRAEFGAVAGVGAEYRISSHWALQAEVRMYYSLTSTTKDYMRVKNPRYNTTIAYQLGCAYCF